MNISITNVEQMPSLMTDALGSIVEVERRNDVEKVQVCLTSNGNLGGIAAYAPILGGEATELVGMQLAMPYYFAGLGSTMLRDYADTQRGEDVTIVGFTRVKSQLMSIFQKASNGAAYPDTEAIMTRGKIAKRLETVAIAAAGESSLVEHQGALSITYKMDHYKREQRKLERDRLEFPPLYVSPYSALVVAGLIRRQRFFVTPTHNNV